MTGSSNGNLVSNLFQTGAVIRANIQIWSGRKKLRPEEIGFDLDDVNNELYSLGSKFLIPHTEIAELEKLRNRARSLIDSNSMKFHFGSFVPNENIPNLKAKLEEIKTEFDEKVSSLGTRYDELRQTMMNKWNDEAMSKMALMEINDPNWLLNVMSKIQECFQPWSVVSNKFRFEIHEYRDINKVAAEFVAESTKELTKKFAEFALTLKEKIENANLKEVNLKKVRNFLDEIKPQAGMFGNPEINEMWQTLSQFASEGSAADVEGLPKFKEAFGKAMDSLVSKAEENIDEIAAESVKRMTNFKRSLDLE